MPYTHILQKREGTPSYSATVEGISSAALEYYARFEETSGNTLAITKAGGTSVGTGTWSGGYTIGSTPVTANSNASIALATNGRAATDNTYGAAFGPNGNWTLSCWVNIPNIAGNYTLFHSGNNAHANLGFAGFTVGVNAGTMNMGTYSAGAWRGDTAGATNLLSNTDYHLVCKFESHTSIKYYVNGVEKNTTSITWGHSGFASNGFFTIGAHYDGNYHNFFNGRMDELAIYQGLVSDADILSLYNAGV